MTTQARCPYPLDASGSDIHGEGAALAERGPATRVILPGLDGNIPAWSVTDPGLIQRLLTSAHISKDALLHWPAYRTGQIPESWPLRIWTDVRNALTAYATEHAHLRRPLAEAFTTRRVRALAPRITQIAEQLLTELRPDRATGIVDLRAQYAWKMPLLVANILLGIPVHLHDGFRDTIGHLFSTNRTPEQGVADRAEIYRLINELIAYKKKHPDDDVTSFLIDAAQRDELSQPSQLPDSLLLLIGAGHETTVGLIDHGIVNLLTHRDQLALATSGTIGWPQVVEETLRHQAPIASILLRFAVHDVHDEISGLTFERGDALIVNFAAAGRAPRVHGQDADTFDLTRTTSRKHIAFGHGTHYCLGAELARLEGRTALKTLATRYPQMRLAADPADLVPLPSFISNGHQKIPVHLGVPAAA